MLNKILPFLHKDISYVADLLGFKPINDGYYYIECDQIPENWPG